MHKFKIHWTFWLLMIFVFLSPKQQIIGKLMLCLFIHEIGHLLILYVKKIPIEKLELYACGFGMDLKQKPVSCSFDLVFYSAGIAFNLIAYGCFSDPQLKQLSLLLALINLIPLEPLDGFHLAKALFERFFPVFHTRYISFFLSFISLAAILWIYLFGDFGYLFLINLAYLVFVLIASWFKRRLVFQRFLLSRYLYPLCLKTRIIGVHRHLERYLYRYRTLIVSVGEKKVTEKEILSIYFQKNKGLR
ncbi:MAG TPA: hypothetical protein IAD46_05635 [Candidatus Pelethenecus faecipullorum]|uniref:Stage IV sporulation protein FB n=1 Tax=Candidatus Pelethenecus faecipullorum TaxID=2840900 RepID=A0A9D1KJH2_9MOLU|nr:hypothetical protein [Candidatus Pelethenecus faecipullorum]